MVSKIFALGLAVMAAGCAPMISGTMNASVTPEEVATKTADYFGVAASSLTITDYEKHTLATTYKTRVDGQLYNCRIYYGEVECRRPGA
jgi:hypothetical protein